tara:strand:+ start:978 stop:1190 length:213 start_codon:yes stop_codon:yes gene_type:complete
MLNTFFFGYLSPKWKRLARVLSILFSPLLLLIGDQINAGEGVYIGATIHIVLVSIVSYTLKPFFEEGKNK